MTKNEQEVKITHNTAKGLHVVPGSPTSVDRDILRWVTWQYLSARPPAVVTDKFGLARKEEA